MSRHLARVVAAALLLLAAWQASAALCIPAKAWVAQRLLEHAWARVEAGETRAKPWPWADTHPVARLYAPRLQVDQIVLEGASGRTLAFGPALAAGSARPSQQGTSIIAGHRDTSFRFLRDLRSGDALELQSPDGGRERFTVTRSEVADSRTTRLNMEHYQRALVLVTCYPFDALRPGGPLRYVVTAEPVNR
jgi:sortase A